MRRLFLLALSLVPAWGCASVAEPQARPHRSRVGKTAPQALLGFADFHKLEFDRTDPGNPTNRVEVDLSEMPALGIAGQLALAGNEVEFGLDGGLLFSWEADREAIAVGGGTVIVALDRSLLVIDGFLGPYLSVMFAERVRLYGAAGVSVMWAEAEYEDELRRESESEWGVGGHARGGIEFRLPDGSMMGLGTRWVANELDFGQPIGDVDLEGWQWFVTYSIGF